MKKKADDIFIIIICLLIFFLGLLIVHGLQRKPQPGFYDLRPVETADPNYKPDPIPTGSLGSTPLLYSVG